MKITKAHGNGGKQTAELLEKIFFPRFASAPLNSRADASPLHLQGQTVGQTIDGFVVSPYRFHGGDIGKLSVCGSVNDLAVSGYRPLFLSVAFMIEEGFEMEELDAIAASMQQIAGQCGVIIAAGDTKVVEKGALDKIFITTSGIGLPFDPCLPSFSRIQPGQSIIVSGDIGRHGACIYSHNQDFGFAETVASDCEPLVDSIARLKKAYNPVFMRDLTRGGLATALNEITTGNNFGIALNESTIPIDAKVNGLCDILGLDPLYLACEGRYVAIVAEDQEIEALSLLKTYHQSAAVIGKIVPEFPGKVMLRTRFAGTRLLDMLYFEMLPRIC